MLSDITDDIGRYGEHFFSALVDRVLPLDIRCRDEHMHHIDIAVKTGINVCFDRSCESADGRLDIKFFNSSNRLFFGF